MRFKISQTDKMLRLLGALLTIFGFFTAIQFTVMFWNVPWPDPILTIDGNSYLNSALGASWSRLFDFSDYYHSPGYALFLRILYSTFGSIQSLIYASKIISLLLFVATGALLYRLSVRGYDKNIAMLALVLFSFSESWRYYCNMIQYEVLTGFFIISFIYLLTAQYTKPSQQLLRRLALVLVLVALSLLHLRNMIFMLVPLAYDYFGKTDFKKLKKSAIDLAAVSAVLAICVALQSYNQSKFIFLMTGTDFRFRLANNPNALGFGYPYPPIIEPSGWEFIFTMPARLLWLMGQRFLYLFGIKLDYWSTPPIDPVKFGTFSWFNLFYALVFFVGFVLLAFRMRQKDFKHELTAVVLTLGVFLISAFGFYGSERFLVPMVPLISLVQAYAVVFLGFRFFKPKL
jgi:hypothetical protein